ncbi:hypothetical protein CC80DRAFT_487752 [Byssothecium circinans]|uniref:Uncharacterized protein n=1 Tax=Byssothecium circinans TaxID=147558 RepID=A0A6A5UC28_9PLEO|nr:hypothetical protein CC80DRAFT_487752 [Byssothecium circinans]
MWQSKYATPEAKARMGISQTASPSTTQAMVSPSRATTPALAVQDVAADSAIAHNGKSDKPVATPEQTDADLIAASETFPSAVQLGLENDIALTKDVKVHVGKLDHSANIIKNIRSVLSLLCETIKKEGPMGAAELDAIQSLWQDLDQLYHTIQGAQAALPALVEKQKDNLDLIVNSLVTESRQDSQAQVNTQHKQLQQQQNVILGQGQAFTDYKARVEPQLKEIEVLNERLARLTLNRTSLSSDLDTANNDAKNSADNHDKAQKSMQDTLQALQSKNDRLTLEYKIMKQFADQVEKKTTDRYEQTCRSIRADLDKEKARAKDLDIKVKALRATEHDQKTAHEKLMVELAAAKDKYQKQSSEYAQVFINSSETNKRLAALKGEIKDLRKQNAELLYEVAKLRQTILDINGQLSALQAERNTAFEEVSQFKEMLEMLGAQAEKLERDNSELEMDNNDLVAKLKKVSQVSAIAEDEAAMLKRTVKTLEEQKGGNAGDGASLKKLKTLEAKLQACEEYTTKLEQDMKGWQELGTRSYTEYKAFREENEKLKKQLEQGGPSSTPTNNAGTNADAVYWRDMYERLLSTFE